MSAPAIEAIKQQLDSINSEYAARFAGQSRVTRDIGEIEALVARSREAIASIEKLPKQAMDGEVTELLTTAKANLELYLVERDAIAEAKQGGPALEEFATLGTQANFVFARYRRHFAGKSRGTRDLGLLAEMVEDLTKIQNRMRTLLGNRRDERMEADIDLVANNLKLYVAERGEIVDARGTGTSEEQADMLAEVANGQFQVYTDHFASKSRLTRRPQLLQRMIDNLKQVKDRMNGLKKAGLKSTSNDRNLEIVDANLQMYITELAEVRKARAGVKLTDLMSNLGGAANDVMEQYRENFAGKDRAGRDLELLSVLADQLGEIARQMTELGRAEAQDFNRKNLQIVTDNIVMFETEYDAIKQAKGAK